MAIQLPIKMSIKLQPIDYHLLPIICNKILPIKLAIQLPIGLPIGLPIVPIVPIVPLCHSAIVSFRDCVIPPLCHSAIASFRHASSAAAPPARLETFRDLRLSGT